VNSPNLPPCFLFDNGSLRAASTLNLRMVAKEVAARTGAVVHAVSLLHSSAVPAEQLQGERARLLEPALLDWLAAGQEGPAVLLPMFFGPSAALTDYVPDRVAAIREKFAQARLELARCMVPIEEADDRVAQALADAARAVIARERLSGAKVLVVDHGSPQRAVAAVRDHLGAQVRGLLDGEVAAVGVASMERRPGPDYAFNDPLLAEALRTAPFDDGEVVLALQFLSPGRHAGEGGDIAEICEAARREKPGLRTWMSTTLGADPRLADVLAERYREVAERLK
jgi:sirohydrochlorin ferrochelatase